MKIKEILNQYRNDYTAIMKCEFCSHEQKDDYGYFDSNYMQNVIPKMLCGNCGKSTQGGRYD